MADLTKQNAQVRHKKYERLIASAKSYPTIKVAVAHPCDEVSLTGAVEAKELGLIELILVGPTDRIRQVAAQAGLNIHGLEIVDADRESISPMSRCR